MTRALVMGIERDLLFTGDFSISVWAEAARAAGSIRGAERSLYTRARDNAGSTLRGADTETRKT